MHPALWLDTHDHSFIYWALTEYQAALQKCLSLWSCHTNEANEESKLAATETLF